MKTKHLLAMGLLFAATSASSQIQLLYTNMGRNVIDRNKKLYWMEGDSDPCYNITSYMRGSSKESFVLVSKEDKLDKYSVVTTINDKMETTHIVIKKGNNVVTDSDVKTTSGNAREDNRMYEYFGGLAGYPKSQIKTVSETTAKPSAKQSAKEVKEGGVKGVTDKAGNTAKEAFGKVKGLFKKKK